jgi:hypothetical protein
MNTSTGTTRRSKTSPTRSSSAFPKGGDGAALSASLATLPSALGGAAFSASSRAYSRVKLNTPSIPVIFTTGWSSRMLHRQSVHRHAVLRYTIAARHPPSPCRLFSVPSGSGLAPAAIFRPPFATPSAYTGRCFVSRCTTNLKRSSNNAWSMSGNWSFDAPGGIVAWMSYRSDHIEAGPVPDSSSHVTPYACLITSTNWTYW